MPGDLVLTIDVGTGSARACVFSIAQNRPLATAGRSSQVSHPGPHRAEFDPGCWWESIVGAMAEAVSMAGRPAEAYLGITVTSLRQGFVLLDDQGQPVAPGVLNYDRRGADYAAVIEEVMRIEDLYRLTGHWHAPELTLPKLLWFSAERPDVWDRVSCFLFIHDWVLYRLCGELATNHTMICAGQMGDVRARGWARDLIGSLGLRLDVLPPVRAAGARLGDLNDQVAAATGLAKGTPVHVGGGDAQFGCLGVGGMAPDRAVIVGGSTTPVLLTSERPLSDPLRYPWVSTHLRPGLWAAETNAGHTGMLYKWFRDTCAQKQVDEAAARGLGPYEVLNGLASEAPIGSDGLLVVAPNPRWAQDTWQRKAPYSFHNFDMSHGLGHMARAIMESVCYGVRGNVEQLQRAAGHPFDRLLFTGGSATVPLWAQMMADVLGRSLHVPQVQEAGAAAGAQLVLWNQASDELLPPPPETTYEPDAECSEQYEPHYRRYLEVFENMQERFGV